MAKAAVFATTELLEAILFLLPPRDILLSQQVSKRFRTVIKQSRKLKCALFLEPIRDSPLFLIRSGKYRPRERTRRLLTVQPESVQQQRGPAYGYAGHAGKLRQIKVFSNPLLKPLIDMLEKIDQRTQAQINKTSIGQHGINSDYWRLGEAWLRSNASWRRMFFTQPTLSRTFIPKSLSRRTLNNREYTGADHAGIIIDRLLEIEQRQQRFGLAPLVTHTLKICKVLERPEQLCRNGRFLRKTWDPKKKGEWRDPKSAKECWEFEVDLKRIQHNQ
jgi:hypothetical protein